MASDLMLKDSMFVVPRDQIQSIPGMLPDDALMFDLFPHSVKPARNVKKDLKAFIKKRSQYSISNLKLPELDEDKKYKPLKHMEPVDNSASLGYNKIKAN